MIEWLKIVKSNCILDLVDVELGHLEEDVSVAAFHEGRLQAMFSNEGLEILAVCDFSKIDSA